VDGFLLSGACLFLTHTHYIAGRPAKRRLFHLPPAPLLFPPCRKFQARRSPSWSRTHPALFLSIYECRSPLLSVHRQAAKELFVLWQPVKAQLPAAPAATAGRGSV